MKKGFRSYTIVWAILLALFNAVVFLVRPIIPGFTVVYDARFWVVWAFVIAAFIGNLICADAAFKAENAEKLFYNVPLISISYTAVILMLVFGAVLLLIPNCPGWIAAIACLAILAFNAIAVVKASAAAEVVSKTGETVKAQTFFIKSLTVDAETLLAKAKSEEAKAACEKVFEAIRYSDPMSNDALADVESQITLKFSAFSDAVTGGADSIGNLADEVVVLIEDRNKKCKFLK